MVRKRFQMLTLFLNLPNSNDLGPSRCVNVVPIYDIMKRNLRQFVVNANDLPINKSMVSYYGWHLCSSDGYPYHLDIYRPYQKEWKRIISIQRVCRDEIRGPLRRHQKKNTLLWQFLHPLSNSTLERLAIKGIHVTWIIRLNRTNNCPLSKDELKITKKNLRLFRWNYDRIARISYELGSYRSTIRGKSGAIIFPRMSSTRWLYWVRRCISPDDQTQRIEYTSQR